MAGAKKQTPAPIDRPLSRAYLRQFTGWSTAYPPGVSEPTSLRLMENVMVNRDGSVRVRPGLKYLAYQVAGEPSPAPLDSGLELRGSHESFFLDDGTKALLFAADNGTRVNFYVAKYLADAAHPYEVLDAGSVFTMDPDDIAFTSATTYVSYVQIDNKILALSNAGESARLFFAGADKHAIAPQTVPGTLLPPTLVEPEAAWIGGTQTSITGAGSETPTANTLICNTRELNLYTIAAFMTFSNEFGESIASDVGVVRVQRPWSGWLWETPNGAGEPSGTATQVATEAADQLIITVGSTDAYDEQIAAGATHINVYVATWSDQDPIPVEAVLVSSKEITGLPADEGGFVTVTPAIPAYTVTAPMPNAINRKDYSAPPTGGQGLVAADRLVMVYDPVNPAVVRWTSNQQGQYLNFTASRGGGFKTLTGGNLYVPACVKLWQNPQSADTLTILCMGVDGRSNGYYMAPAQVASQSEATNVMGFEETTATPGTTSPYGCEVANNALYHPLDTQLMKSTAQNYNINHKSMTDAVADRWAALADKDQIVSCLHESRLYYVVHNPDGEDLEDGCMGNEIWVLDTAAKTPSWSRWLIQAVSLRTVEVLGRIYLSVVRPDGIFYLDETAPWDEAVGTGTIVTASIPWKLETNTQGANRAHDAWAHLQQANVVFGNFQGTARVGVRGRNVHGRSVDINKLVRAPIDLLPDVETWDLEDYLKIGHDMKEWFFYAESIETGGGVQPSAGQISLVQYRYTPVSVNVGYEYGSVETFEYGRAGNTADARTTDNGIPMPMIDTDRP